MPKKSTANARWLKDTRIQFVSLVDKAANDTTFLIMKNAGCTKTFEVNIAKTWAGEDPEGPRYVTGIVYQPDVVDTQGDAMNAEEVEKAAYWYMRNGRSNDIQHNGVQCEGIHLVESAVTKSACTIGDVKVPAGTWYITVEINNPEIRKAVRDGELTGFSMGGLSDVEKAAEEKPPAVKPGLWQMIKSALGISTKSAEAREGDMEHTQEQTQLSQMIAKAVGEGVSEAFAAQKAAEAAEAKKAADEKRVQELEAEVERLKQQLAQQGGQKEAAKTPPQFASDKDKDKTKKDAEGDTAAEPEGAVEKDAEGAAATETISEGELADTISKAVAEGLKPFGEMISKAYGRPQNLNGEPVRKSEAVRMFEDVLGF